MSTQQQHPSAGGSHPRPNDPNAVAVRINQFWTNFKQGKIISYKLMGLILLLLVVTGTIIYISYETVHANSALWRAFVEADSLASAEELSKNNPNSLPDRLARLQVARYQLGVAGIEQLGATRPDDRKKAIENIEKARAAMKALLPEFEGDPVFKAECLLGLAKAEAALVPVPVKEGELNEFKGSVPMVVEYLDKLAKAAAPDTPWAVNSAKLADALRNPTSSTAHDFVLIEQELFHPLFGGLGGGVEPSPALGPGLTPPLISGVPSAPLPPLAPKQGPVIESNPPPPTPPGPKPVPQVPVPVGPNPPPLPSTTTPPSQPGPMPPVAPGPTPPKGQDTIPAPIAPPPKAPDAKTPAPAPVPQPKAPEKK